MVCDVTELLVVDVKLALDEGVVCVDDVVMALVSTGLDLEDSCDADEEITVVEIDDCPVSDDDWANIGMIKIV